MLTSIPEHRPAREQRVNDTRTADIARLLRLIEASHRRATAEARLRSSLLRRLRQLEEQAEQVTG